MRLIAIEEATGKKLKKGDIITDFRGDKDIFEMPTRKREIGRSGKIRTKDRYEYYDKVFGIIVIEQ